MSTKVNRCPWANASQLEQVYHDTEWCKKNTSDQYLFELLILETQQAGLSWSLILQRRATYQKAFFNFDIEKILSLSVCEKEKLYLSDTKIIKHRKKFDSIFKNAQAFKNIQKEYGSFSNFIWSFVQNEQIVNHFITSNEVPAYTDLSILISKEMKKRQFSFVGPTVIYSFMQAIGLVNDHLVDCSFR